MASYLDEQYQFAPYIETVPVEEMVKVGMAKQKMFDEGVQKVQSWFDQLAALPTARQVDADYVQSAINNLNAEIGKVVGADWSNQQLLNSVGGLATKISRDKNIVTAVQSANRISEGSKKIDEDRAKGTLRPENEFAFYESVQSFKKSTELGRSFNDDYFPGFDVEKYVKETFDAIKPENFSFDQVFKTGLDGRVLINKETGGWEYSPTMSRFEWESPTFQRVRATLDKIFSEPRVNRQLEITGRYLYKPYEGQDLKRIVGERGTSLLRDFENSLEQLYYRKSQATTDKDRLEIQQTIDTVLDNKKIVSSYYDDLASAVDKNPEGVRANIYKNEVKNQYTSMYNWKKTKYSQLENPGAQYAISIQKMAQDASQFAEKIRLEYAQLKSVHEYRQSMAGSARIRALKSGSGDGDVDIDIDGDGLPDTPAGTGLGGVTGADKPSDLDPYEAVTAKWEKDGNTLKNVTNSLLWEGMLRKNPETESLYVKYINGGMQPEAALNKIIEENAAKNNMTVPEYKALNSQTIVTDYNNLSPDQKKKSPQLGTAVESFRVATRDFKTSSDVMESVEKRAGSSMYNRDKVVKSLNLKPQTVVIGNKTYNLSPEDIYDLGVVLRGNTSSLYNDAASNTEAKRAEKSLKDRGLEPVVYDMLAQSTGILSRAGETPGPITYSLRNLRYAPYNAFGDSSWWGDDITTSSNEGTQQLEDVFKWLNTEGYSENIKAKQQAAREIYNVPPNASVMLYKAKDAENKELLAATRVLSSQYKSGTAANKSKTFDGFVGALSEAKWSPNNIISFNVDVEADGTPTPKVTISNGAKVLGQMNITMDEAIRVYKKNPYALFEPADVTMLRNAIDQNPLLQTSAADPTDKETYKRGDYYHSKEDFPNLVNSNLTVNVNYGKVNGKFYPYVYASDGQTDAVFQLDGNDNLNVVIQSLKNVLDVPRIMAELKRLK